MTHRNTRRKRLEAEGWLYVSGWLGPSHKRLARSVERAIAEDEPEAARIASEPGKPGRPRMVQPPKEMG